MSILAGYVVPHPPLIIPSVGRGEERGIQKTIDAYREIARRIAALRPETIVVSSPHAPLYRDGFHVTTDTVLNGSMEAFRAPQTTMSAKIDTALADEIIQNAQQSGIVVAPSTWRDHDMDHATFTLLNRLIKKREFRLNIRWFALVFLCFRLKYIVSSDMLLQVRLIGQRDVVYG